QFSSAQHSQVRTPLRERLWWLQRTYDEGSHKVRKRISKMLARHRQQTVNEHLVGSLAWWAGVSAQAYTRISLRRLHSNARPGCGVCRQLSQSPPCQFHQMLSHGFFSSLASFGVVVATLVSSVTSEVQVDSKLDLVDISSLSERQYFLFVLQCFLVTTIPLLFLAQTIDGVTGFSLWVIFFIAWTFQSAFAVVIQLLWESFDSPRED
ncbi:hypothetical protein BD769DRAFT_1481966, partial [Suillus cothurnatus]